MDVGFIGLGRMGGAMARNIAKAGYSVHAWNRSGLREPIEGVSVAASPAQAFQSDVIFTMLSDDPAIREVVLSPNLLRSARKGAVHVVTATISIDFADELAAIHRDAGIGYVSAPVFGRPDVAESGQLNVLAAGAKDAVETVRPLLDAIGQKTWVIGEDPKQANAAKIAGNMMITMAIEAMAEAVVLTGSNGVSAETFFDVILNTLFGGRAYQTYGAKIANGDYEPGFRLTLGLKDLGLAAAAADKAGKHLPMLNAVRARMSEAAQAGWGERDWSAMADFTINHRS